MHSMKIYISQNQQRNGPRGPDTQTHTLKYIDALVKKSALKTFLEREFAAWAAVEVTGWSREGKGRNMPSDKRSGSGRKGQNWMSASTIQIVLSLP